MKKLFLIFVITALYMPAQETGLQIGRLKYDGGGDWYNDQSAEINLLKFIASETGMPVKAQYQFVDIASDELFSYPILFMTGHGNITFSAEEAERLRLYLENGGFLYADDDYGMDDSFRREMQKVLPGSKLLEIPFDHDIYHIKYDFPQGPPKVHEHDNKPPQGFAMFIGERMAVYYTYESNPSDGWADAEVHNNPEEVRENALKFGTNIILYAVTR